MDQVAREPVRSTRDLMLDAAADAVVARLGDRPRTLNPVRYSALPPAVPRQRPAPRTPERKTMDGVDVFVHDAGVSPDTLAVILRKASKDSYLKLQMLQPREGCSRGSRS